MKYKQAVKAVIFMSILLLTLIFSAHAIAKPNELAKQIEALSEQLEQKRIEYNIPGMAIAVVKNDQVILSKSFGMMDLANKTPVKPDTLFSIGSSTKAITATMLGMLADQGKLDWDQKVTDQLPGYQFKVLLQPQPVVF